MGKYMKEQMSFVLGMILGDGYVTKFREKKTNATLSCQHSDKQLEYLNYKKEELEKLGFSVKGIYDVSQNTFKSYRFDCYNPHLFNQLRLVLYPKNNKTIKRKWLNYLDEKGLAIWFMDDGSLTKRGKSGYISLHTNNFGIKEHRIIIKYFKQKWKLHPTLRVVKRKNKNQSFFLVFSPDETRKFIEVVKPHIIEIMKYKVDFE